MSYDILLLDIDNTLLDFSAGSRASIRAMMEHYGVEFTEERINRYFSINDGLWEAFERGEIPKQHIYQTRFPAFFSLYGVEISDGLAANEVYTKGLATYVYRMPQCLEFLEAAKARCRLFAVTNGDTENQRIRLKTSGIGPYFEKVFISEQMGCKKPDKLFFDLVFEQIGPCDKSRCLLLGDSLTSDMQGGRNAGIDTCLIGKPVVDPRCDYVIQNLMELLPILDSDRT